jgi:hypothetical protein
VHRCFVHYAHMILKTIKSKDFFVADAAIPLNFIVNLINVSVQLRLVSRLIIAFQTFHLYFVFSLIMHPQLIFSSNKITF